MLVSSKKIIELAQKHKYAVGAFNTSDLEITKAIINAGIKENAPLIVQVTERAIAFAGLEEMVQIIKTSAEKAKIPVVLHLDHGKTLDIVNKCLQVGFNSVMFDGSALTFEENKVLTARAVEMAHRYKAHCEGELGHVSKFNEESDKKLTDPDQVNEFAKFTKVDSLAVSIGSSHGIGEDEKLDIPLLKKIRAKTNIPLVLHGGSGLPEDDVREAIKNGICKINIDTDIRHTFSKTIHDINKKYSDLNDPRDIMNKVILEIQKVVEAKIKLFGSVGKGDL